MTCFIYFSFVFHALSAGFGAMDLYLVSKNRATVSEQIPSLPADRKTSHLISAIKNEIVLGYGTETTSHTRYIWEYLASVTWTQEDSTRYKDLFEKKFLIARDLLLTHTEFDTAFNFLQGRLPNGDAFFIGSLGHYIAISRDGATLYKGKINAFDPVHFNAAEILEQNKLPVDYHSLCLEMITRFGRTLK